MGLLDFIPIVGPAINAATGLMSASNARDAFKHRYQDTVKDMRKAGLNPALAYGQGGGSPQTVPLPQVGDEIAEGINKVASARQARAQTALVEQQTKLLKAQERDIIQQADLRTNGMMMQNILTDFLGQRAGTAAAVDRESAHADISTRKMAAQLQGLQLPEARATAKFFEGFGQHQRTFTNAMELLRALSALIPRR